ncbi:SusC/RagA family TonB-linked outer membrane protein [Chitinophaga sp. SYP-B3965]|uniref:SusC/RagA family TonB-linked outer membrane protein n=1 Tax=Chitinophaga sp. SYP-B3965 TaxID=2663120 RepID=UPI001299B220|nr:TonB-dependent receptor [Chitinophaga sp. SYP-B3965]MRG45176.1 SusC/RagA family TonB-linked outer membrane protein [Chitinophaga sp. SYP-B3965]
MILSTHVNAARRIAKLTFMLLMTIVVNAFAYDINIRGKVTDGSGQTLPGVTVLVKGTSIGGVTAADGTYQLKVPEGATALVFKFIGMQEQEVEINKRTVIDIVMSSSVKSLDETVVVGYGTQKKVNLTGAVSTVTSKALESRPVSNVAQALQGIAPGLNITQSGALGGSMENRPNINIRGVGTIGVGSSGSPLILIDGMEGDINGVSPQDIDNISVLKDAAASSIYGTRAPFGVILITTKRGKAGKTTVNISSNFRASSPVLLPHTMDSYTFATYFNDANVNSGNGVYFQAARMQRIKDFMDGKIKTTIIPRPGQPNLWADGYYEGNDNVDWYKAIYKDHSPSQEYSLSASGGKEKLTYFLSANYLDQVGLMRFGTDKFKRYNVTGKINAELNDWASLTYITRFSREEFTRPSVMTNGLNQQIAPQGWPMLPLYDNNGFLYDSPSPALALRDGGIGAKQYDVLSQQLKLTLEPLKGWKVMADLNYSISSQFYHWDIQRTYNHDVAGNPYVVQTATNVHEEASRNNYLNTNVYTEYARSLGGHNLKILAGTQTELTKTRFIMAERNGLISPDLPVLDVTSGNDYAGKAVPPNVGGNYQKWMTTGFFGRLNYDYKGRYLLEANLRYDGTSRFRRNMRWMYSPSVSAGWNIDKEAFWEPLHKYVNALKLRGSYGELGNQNTSLWYPTYITMPIGNSNGAWLVNGAKPNTASAPLPITSDLHWEKIRTWNIGVDAAFLRNRLTATFEYYTRYTNNMIGPAPELPDIFGTTVPQMNNTDLKTTGWEMDLSWRDQLKNGLGYSVRILLSDARTTITEYPNATKGLGTYIAGHDMGEIWGYNTIGIAKTQAEMDAHLAKLTNGGQNALGSNWKAGDLMFRDLNGDGKITSGSNTANNPGDLMLIGNNTPRYMFGTDIGADWKGLDFRAFFQGVLKRDYFQNGYYFWGASASIWGSAGLTEHADYFRDDPNHALGLNLDSYYPRPLFSAKNQVVQTRYLQDASYVRLKNLQLGYTLPISLTRRAGIQKFRVYVSGENIFTITKMATMFDPETVDGGYGGSVYPLFKVYAVGLNITL